MKKQAILEHIQIAEFSATPKYLQLTNTIISAIKEGKILKEEVLPSITELSQELDISRDTVERGYKHLKSRGVLGSVPGKGYFVASTEFHQNLKIVLFFNKLSPHKKIIYDAFVETVGNEASIDFYIYNNDFTLFKKLLKKTIGNYTHYVVIPHFFDGGEEAYEIINTIPKDKLILVDKKIKGITGDYAAVYEDFENDIAHALEEGKELLSKYHTLKLIFPRESYFPKEIINGFKRFCLEYAFNSEVIHDVNAEMVQPGIAYVNLIESDLVPLIKKILASPYVVGEDVGVISYNETPLKEIILNGITTVSTDFYKMGKIAAELVLNGSKEHIEVPFYFNARSSL